jgi:hypothetical protein
VSDGPWVLAPLVRDQVDALFEPSRPFGAQLRAASPSTGGAPGPKRQRSNVCDCLSWLSRPAGPAPRAVRGACPWRLCPSPDASWLAIRGERELTLRHVSSGFSGTVAVVTVTGSEQTLDPLAQSAWSANSRWLVAPIRGECALLGCFVNDEWEPIGFSVELDLAAPVWSAEFLEDSTLLVVDHQGKARRFALSRDERGAVHCVASAGVVNLEDEPVGGALCRLDPSHVALVSPERLAVVRWRSFGVAECVLRMNISSEEWPAVSPHRQPLVVTAASASGEARLPHGESPEEFPLESSSITSLWSGAGLPVHQLSSCFHASSGRLAVASFGRVVVVDLTRGSVVARGALDDADGQTLSLSWMDSSCLLCSGSHGSLRGLVVGDGRLTQFAIEQFGEEEGSADMAVFTAVALNPNSLVRLQGSVLLWQRTDRLTGEVVDVRGIRRVALGALWRVEPSELFQQALKSGDMQGALDLARKYGLSEEPIATRLWEMYRRGETFALVDAAGVWREAESFADAVERFLGRTTSDVPWLVSQCLDTIPPSVSDARLLVEHALTRRAAGELTSACHRRHRAVLLYDRLHSVSSSGSWLDRYDHSMVLWLEHASPSQVALRLAADGLVQALAVMFAEYPVDLEPFRLALMGSLPLSCEPDQWVRAMMPPVLPTTPAASASPAAVHAERIALPGSPATPAAWASWLEELSVLAELPAPEWDVACALASEAMKRCAEPTQQPMVVVRPAALAPRGVVLGRPPARPIVHAVRERPPARPIVLPSTSMEWRWLQVCEQRQSATSIGSVFEAISHLSPGSVAAAMSRYPAVLREWAMRRLLALGEVDLGTCERAITACLTHQPALWEECGELQQLRGEVCFLRALERARAHRGLGMPSLASWHHGSPLDRVELVLEGVEPHQLMDTIRDDIYAHLEGWSTSVADAFGLPHEPEGAALVQWLTVLLCLEQFKIHGWSPSYLRTLAHAIRPSSPAHMRPLGSVAGPVMAGLALLQMPISVVMSEHSAKDLRLSVLSQLDGGDLVPPSFANRVVASVRSARGLPPWYTSACRAVADALQSSAVSCLVPTVAQVKHLVVRLEHLVEHLHPLQEWIPPAAISAAQLLQAEHSPLSAGSPVATLLDRVLQARADALDPSSHSSTLSSMSIQEASQFAVELSKRVFGLDQKQQLREQPSRWVDTVGALLELRRRAFPGVPLGWLSNRIGLAVVRTGGPAELNALRHVYPDLETVDAVESSVLAMLRDRLVNHDEGCNHPSTKALLGTVRDALSVMGAGKEEACASITQAVDIVAAANALGLPMLPKALLAPVETLMSGETLEVLGVGGILEGVIVDVVHGVLSEQCLRELAREVNQGHDDPEGLLSTAMAHLLALGGSFESVRPASSNQWASVSLQGVSLELVSPLAVLLKVLDPPPRPTDAADKDSLEAMVKGAVRALGGAPSSPAAVVPSRHSAAVREYWSRAPDADRFSLAIDTGRSRFQQLWTYVREAEANDLRMAQLARAIVSGSEGSSVHECSDTLLAMARPAPADPAAVLLCQAARWLAVRNTVFPCTVLPVTWEARQGIRLPVVANLVKWFVQERPQWLASLQTLVTALAPDDARAILSYVLCEASAKLAAQREWASLVIIGATAARMGLDEPAQSQIYRFLARIDAPVIVKQSIRLSNAVHGHLDLEGEEGVSARACLSLLPLPFTPLNLGEDSESWTTETVPLAGVEWSEHLFEAKEEDKSIAQALLALSRLRESVAGHDPLTVWQEGLSVLSLLPLDSDELTMVRTAVASSPQDLLRRMVQSLEAIGSVPDADRLFARVTSLVELVLEGADAEPVDEGGDELSLDVTALWAPKTTSAAVRVRDVVSDVPAARAAHLVRSLRRDGMSVSKVAALMRGMRKKRSWHAGSSATSVAPEVDPVTIACELLLLRASSSSVPLPWEFSQWFREAGLAVALVPECATEVNAMLVETDELGPAAAWWAAANVLQGSLERAEGVHPLTSGAIAQALREGAGTHLWGALSSTLRDRLAARPRELDLLLMEGVLPQLRLRGQFGRDVELWSALHSRQSDSLVARLWGVVEKAVVRVRGRWRAELEGSVQSDVMALVELSGPVEALGRLCAMTVSMGGEGDSMGLLRVWGSVVPLLVESGIVGAEEPSGAAELAAVTCARWTPDRDDLGDDERASTLVRIIESGALSGKTLHALAIQLCPLDGVRLLNSPDFLHQIRASDVRAACQEVIVASSSPMSQSVPRGKPLPPAIATAVLTALFARFPVVSKGGAEPSGGDLGQLAVKRVESKPLTAKTAAAIDSVRWITSLFELCAELDTRGVNAGPLWGAVEAQCCSLDGEPLALKNWLLDLCIRFPSAECWRVVSDKLQRGMECAEAVWSQEVCHERFAREVHRLAKWRGEHPTVVISSFSGADAASRTRARAAAFVAAVRSEESSDDDVAEVVNTLEAISGVLTVAGELAHVETGVLRDWADVGRRELTEAGGVLEAFCRCMEELGLATDEEIARAHSRRRREELRFVFDDRSVEGEDVLELARSLSSRLDVTTPVSFVRQVSCLARAVLQSPSALPWPDPDDLLTEETIEDWFAMMASHNQHWVRECFLALGDHLEPESDAREVGMALVRQGTEWARSNPGPPWFHAALMCVCLRLSVELRLTEVDGVDAPLWGVLRAAQHCLQPGEDEVELLKRLVSAHGEVSEIPFQTWLETALVFVLQAQEGPLTAETAHAVMGVCGRGCLAALRTREVPWAISAQVDKVETSGWPIAAIEEVPLPRLLKSLAREMSVPPLLLAGWPAQSSPPVHDDDEAGWNTSDWGDEEWASTVPTTTSTEAAVASTEALAVPPAADAVASREKEEESSWFDQDDW